jgi:predicted nucleic acid-binding protein
VKAADTSTVVAAFATWHEKHELARRALDTGLHLVAHCALETYSVLTRLPSPHRVAGQLVREFIAARFPDPLLQLSARQFRDFVLGLAGHRVTGGAAYDALVAATALAHKVDLVTCDGRAAPVYERYGVKTVLF